MAINGASWHVNMRIIYHESAKWKAPIKVKMVCQRIAGAFGYSMAGLRAAYEYEAAIRQELLLAIVLIPLGVYLGHGKFEQVLLVGVIFLVLIVELLNSAIEAAVDHTSTEASCTS